MHLYRFRKVSKSSNFKKGREMKYLIKDWASNITCGYQFETWEEAEDYLCEILADNYEECRGEYYIVEIEERKEQTNEA